jgi:CBS domain-containing protein
MAGLIDALSISNYMTKDVKTATERQSMKEVTKLMYENDIGCLVIVSYLDLHKPTGIVTERDILKVISLDQLTKPASSYEISLFDLTVQSFMTKPVITIAANRTLWDAIQTMQQNNIRRLPVTGGTNNWLVGIITEKDVMRAIAKNRTIFCDLTDRLPGNSLMIERIREIGLSESFFWPGDTGPTKL